MEGSKEELDLREVKVRRYPRKVRWPRGHMSLMAGSSTQNINPGIRFGWNHQNLGAAEMGLEEKVRYSLRTPVSQ